MLFESGFGITPWVGRVAGGVISAVLALILGYFCFGLKGHYFAIATMVIAEIGLVMFMFVVGVELDTRLIKGRERAAAIIATTSVALPFALGTVVAVGYVESRKLGESLDPHIRVDHPPNRLLDVLPASEMVDRLTCYSIRDQAANVVRVSKCQKYQAGLSSDREHMRRAVGDLVGPSFLVLLDKPGVVFSDRAACNNTRLRLISIFQAVDIDRVLIILNQNTGAYELFQILFCPLKNRFA